MKKKFKLILVVLLAIGQGVGAQVREVETSVAEVDSLSVGAEMNATLDEISIVAAKPLIKAEVDKTTYNIEDDPDAKTNTLLEMLRKVPMVTVDGNDNIKVNGNSSFKIYMNNKPSNMLARNPQDVLRSIPASSIKKIEVIASPGARYDAEGVSGILNIITRNVSFEGYNANLNAIALSKMAMAGGFVTMKYGRFSLSGNYSYYNQFGNKLESNYNRCQSNNPDEALLSIRSTVKPTSRYHYGALEGSFEIDSLNLLTLSGSVDVGTARNRIDGKHLMTDAGRNPVYAYNQVRESKNEYGSQSFKVDYQHLFKRNKEELLTLSYLFDRMPDDRFDEFYLTDREGASPSLQYLSSYNRQINDAELNGHIFQADYVNPFTPKHSLEGGLKYIRRNNLSHATSEAKNDEASPWQPSDFQPLTTYRHVQNILALYAGYTFKSGQWGANGGLRMEHTRQQVDYEQGDGTDFDALMTDLVPSLSVSYRLNDSNQLRFSYNIRLRRPGIEKLNLYVVRSGSDISYGSPSLTSDKHHGLTASYNYLSAKLNIQSSILYMGSRGSITNYQFFDTDGVLNRTYGNLLDSKGGALSVYVGYNPSANTSLSVNGVLQYLSLYTQQGQPGSLARLSNRGFSGSGYIEFSQKLGKGWRFVGSFACMKPEVSLGGQTLPYLYYGMSIVKTCMDDRLTFMLRAQDFLTPYVSRTYEESYPDFTSLQRNRMYSRSFGLSVGYRFGGLKAAVKKTLRTIGGDDLAK